MSILCLNSRTHGERPFFDHHCRVLAGYRPPYCWVSRWIMLYTCPLPHLRIRAVCSSPAAWTSGSQERCLFIPGLLQSEHSVICFNSLWSSIVEKCSPTCNKKLKAVAITWLWFSRVYLFSTHYSRAVPGSVPASSKTWSFPGFLRMVNCLQAFPEFHWGVLAQAFHARCSANISRHFSVGYRPGPFQGGFGPFGSL